MLIWVILMLHCLFKRSEGVLMLLLQLGDILVGELLDHHWKVALVLLL